MKRFFPGATLSQNMLYPSVASFGLSLLSALPAFGDGSLLLEEVVVTANKRQENLSDVGVSATAFSGEALSQLGLVNTEDLTKVTPALNVNYANPSVSQLSIRGVSQNDFADHLETPIAVYHDEGYIGTSGATSVPLFDIERVEVLRGPQGTLFGRNATGGLLHFISRKPSDDLNGYVEASYGRFNTYNIQGALGGPITDDIRGRIAFTRNQSDGPYKNIVTGDKDVGDTNNQAVRGQVSMDIGDSTVLDFLASYDNVDQHGPVWPFRVTQPGTNGLGVEVPSNQTALLPNIVLGGEISAPCTGCNLVGYQDSDGNPWTVASNVPGYFKRDIYKGQFKLSHDFDSFTFTAISDVLDVEKDTVYDTDMSPQSYFVYAATQDYSQFSQEFRFNGESGDLKWVTGVYYLTMDGSYTQPLDLDLGVYVGAPLCVGVDCDITEDSTIHAHFEPQYDLNVDSYAVFAQGEYALSNNVAVTLGLRYTDDDKEFDYYWSDVYPFSEDTAALHYSDEATFENIAAKLQVDWRPTDHTLIFASYTRGHKGGNWAAPAFPPIDTEALPHDQEVLISYEVGIKTTLLDGLAVLNASTYFYDYSDYQAFSLQGLGQSIFNKEAEAYGGEIELRIAPTEALEISANAALVESTVKDISLPNGDVVDRELPNSAPVQLTGLIRYRWDLMAGELSAQASGKYMADHYLTVLNEPANEQEAYTTVDLRLAWLNAEGNIELSLYGNNITDEYYKVWALDVSALSLGNSVPGARKTWGARVKYNF